MLSSATSGRTDATVDLLLNAIDTPGGPVFPMVGYRLTVAAPLDDMDDVLAACDALGCVHVQPYEQFEEGIGVGQAAAQKVVANC